MLIATDSEGLTEHPMVWPPPTFTSNRSLHGQQKRIEYVAVLSTGDRREDGHSWRADSSRIIRWRDLNNQPTVAQIQWDGDVFISRCGHFFSSRGHLCRRKVSNKDKLRRSILPYLGIPIAKSRCEDVLADEVIN